MTMTTSTSEQTRASYAVAVKKTNGAENPVVRVFATIQLIIQCMLKFTFLLACLTPPMQLRWHSSHASWTFQSQLPPTATRGDHYFSKYACSISQLSTHNASVTLISWVPEFGVCLEFMLHAKVIFLLTTSSTIYSDYIMRSNCRADE